MGRILIAALFVAGCFDSHRRGATEIAEAAAPAESGVDSGSDGALVSDASGGWVEGGVSAACPAGEAMLEGTGPSGPGSELRYSAAAVVECWRHSEVLLTFDRLLDSPSPAELSVHAWLEGVQLVDGEPFTGTVPARVTWAGLDGEAPEGTLRIDRADPARFGEIGWIRGHLEVVSSEVRLSGSFRAPYCDISVCL